MTKFKVGDLVDFQPRTGFGLCEEEGPFEVTQIGVDTQGRDTIRVKAEDATIRRFDYLTSDFKLHVPPIPLFRKGDKVVVEYEVIADEPPQLNGVYRPVYVTANGVRAGGGVARLAEFLAAGTITRAPEPSYLPKPGDKFIFSGSRCLCIFADAKSIMYENRTSGYRYVCSPSLYQFKKDTD